jgi:hypothetical protein
LSWLLLEVSLGFSICLGLDKLSLFGSLIILFLVFLLDVVMDRWDFGNDLL